MQKYSTITVSICKTIDASTLLTPFILEGINKYAAADTKNMMSARAETIIIFGPSGSAKKESSIREQATAVAANMISGMIFDLKFMLPVLFPKSICGVFTQI